MRNALPALFAAALLAFSVCHSEITATSYADGCSYSIQVNEDSEVLFTVEGSVPGDSKGRCCDWYDDCSYGCAMDVKSLPQTSAQVGRNAFKNSKGENCFLDNFGFGSATRCYLFSGASFRVACEPPASIPERCGKSKNYASQVILENSRAGCDSIGGEFEGGVYPHETPDGETEWCESGSCRGGCVSEWRNNLIKNYKDSVCCGNGYEPTSNNGSCREAAPMDSTKIGVNYPKVTALPKCSGVPAGGAGNYCGVPQSSSSFEPEPSSSSLADGSLVQSSSSLEEITDEMEEAECPFSEGERISVLSQRNWECKIYGKASNYSISGGCVVGSCEETPSSSSVSEFVSSSSGDGGGGGDVCSDGLPALQKGEADLYSDWVYIGTEKYGSQRQAERASAFTGMYFDALGRISEKMFGSRFYFLKNRSVRGDWESGSEFEVYKKIIIDEQGNDIEVFIKEDKKNGIRKDSTHYANGYWEVFDIKDETEVSLKNSSGTMTSTIRDNEGKLYKRILINENGDTAINNSYIWKDGLLIKEIGINGIRIFSYGDNPYEDSVRVSPSDNGHYFHQGYDGSVGMIPRKGDANYERYLANPYGVWTLFTDTITENSFGVNALLKGNYNFVTLVPGMPTPEYKNTPWSDTLNAECRKSGRCLPIPYNGRSYIAPSFTNVSCSCNDGKYLMEYEIAMRNPSIELLQSFITFDMESILQGKKKRWMRNCLTKGEIQDTYGHEVKHHKNALNKMIELANKYMPKDKFKTHEECKEAGSKASKIIASYMDEWLIKEQEHLTEESPKNTGLKQGERCDE